jgi:hypothetical protein
LFKALPDKALNNDLIWNFWLFFRMERTKEPFFNILLK